jgi:L-fuconolactonase
MPTYSTRVLDAQVHCYERNHPERPWLGRLAGPSEVTGGDMVAFMDAHNIDGALLVSPWSMYRFDASYALDVLAAYPDRYRLIKPFDPARLDVAEDVEQWTSTPGAVAGRIMMGAPAADTPDLDGIDRILNAAAQHSLPMNVLCWGNIELFAEVAQRHQSVQLIIDHLGILQPFNPPVPETPFAHLEDVLQLAEFENVAIKISGACTLANTPFPFPDIWPPILEIVAAFGIERSMWGTDWTRAVEIVSPSESVNAFRECHAFNVSDLEQLMGGSLARIYNWT